MPDITCLYMACFIKYGNAVENQTSWNILIILLFTAINITNVEDRGVEKKNKKSNNTSWYHL